MSDCKCTVRQCPGRGRPHLPGVGGGGTTVQTATANAMSDGYRTYKLPLPLHRQNALHCQIALHCTVRLPVHCTALSDFPTYRGEGKDGEGDREGWGGDELTDSSIHSVVAVRQQIALHCTVRLPLHCTDCTDEPCGQRGQGRQGGQAEKRVGMAGGE